MRKYANEVLLFVVNFGETDMQVAVNLPQHAFDYLQMPAMERCEAKDVLNGGIEEISFTPDKPVELNLHGLESKILKICF